MMAVGKRVLMHGIVSFRKVLHTRLYAETERIVQKLDLSVRRRGERVCSIGTP